MAALDGSSSGTAPRGERAFSRDGGATWTVVAGCPGTSAASRPRSPSTRSATASSRSSTTPTSATRGSSSSSAPTAAASFVPVALPESPGLGDERLRRRRFRRRMARVRGLRRVGADPDARRARHGAGAGRCLHIADAPGRRRRAQAGRRHPPGRSRRRRVRAGALLADPDGERPARRGRLGGRRLRVAHPGRERARATRICRARSSPSTDPAAGSISCTPTGSAGRVEEIRLNFSGDGTDWSAAITVNDPVASTTGCCPTSPSTAGRIGVAWYDFRNGGAQLWGDQRATVAPPPSLARR